MHLSIFFPNRGGGGDIDRCIRLLAADIRARTRENRSSGFSISSDTNRAVQQQKMFRGLKFWILEEEGLSYLCSENKGADKLCGYSAQLICVFVFAHAKDRVFHDAAHNINCKT